MTKLPNNGIGYVYAVKAVGSPFVKIGWSKEPISRMNTGATWCPHPVDLYLVIEGDKDRERAIQRDLRQQRHHREWYLLNEYSTNYLLNLEDEDVRHGTDEIIEGD